MDVRPMGGCAACARVCIRAGPVPRGGENAHNACCSNKHTMTGNTSLSSVVSDLVRAQMGTAVSSSVTDEDLDRHVAELILKEAKKKADQYSQQGVRAYLPQFVYSSLSFTPLRTCSY